MNAAFDTARSEGGPHVGTVALRSSGTGAAVAATAPGMAGSCLGCLGAGSGVAVGAGAGWGGVGLALVVLALLCLRQAVVVRRVCADPAARRRATAVRVSVMLGAAVVGFAVVQLVVLPAYARALTRMTTR